jgi:uncharacterized protein YheU (UPF0270 family)
MDEEEVEPVEIPVEQLSADALRGVIDDFVLREGTDYGLVEVSLERKREQVLAQLKSGKARVLFDPRTETCTISLQP